MTDQKPLHVRVAWALGWSAFRSHHGYWVVTHGIGAEEPGYRCDLGYGKHFPLYDDKTGERFPERRWWDDCDHVPPFGEDSPEGWACTGPLIDRFKIVLLWQGYAGPPQHYKRLDEPYWHAVYGYYETYDGWGSIDDADGKTPLEAVCNLIVALAEAGRLPR